ncbi:hypothetical protein CAJAP_09169 [Camponotus japonicus]
MLDSTNCCPSWIILSNLLPSLKGGGEALYHCHLPEDHHLSNLLPTTMDFHAQFYKLLSDTWWCSLTC